MKSLNVSYDPENDHIAPVEKAEEEVWTDVCARFDDDVRRVKSIEHPDGYTALYLCFDGDNVPFYYIVREDERLTRLRHKVFLSKLGMEAE